jgi:phosphate-selective porin OprO/OprP
LFSLRQADKSSFEEYPNQVISTETALGSRMAIQGRGWLILVVILIVDRVHADELPPLNPPTQSSTSVDPKTESPTSIETLPPTTLTHPGTLAEQMGLLQNVKLRGRIEADAVFASQSTTSKAIIGDLQNAFGFRRARIGAEGTVGSSAKWVGEFDFAEGTVRLRDTFVGITALPGIRELKVGYFREPFSLEGATSSRFITFLERSPLNQIDPTRNWGLAGYWYPDPEQMTIGLGVFRDGTNSTGFESGDGNNWAITTRITGLPLYEEDDDRFRLFHIGAAFSNRVPDNGIFVFDLGAQSSLLSASDVAPSPFLPRVQIPAGSDQRYNLQSALVIDSWSLQSEWFGLAVQQYNSSVVFLHGFYVYSSYFLTGEHRGYNKRNASFDRVKVRRPLVKTKEDTTSGLGAFEFSARFALANFDSLNLQVPQTNGPQVGVFAGTILYQATLGLNWYLNDYTRIMFNYTLAVPDVRGFPAVPVHVFGIRTAIFW